MWVWNSVWQSDTYIDHPLSRCWGGVGVGIEEPHSSHNQQGQEQNGHHHSPYCSCTNPWDKIKGHSFWNLFTWRQMLKSRKHSKIDFGTVHFPVVCLLLLLLSFWTNFGVYIHVHFYPSTQRAIHENTKLKHKCPIVLFSWTTLWLYWIFSKHINIWKYYISPCT